MQIDILTKPIMNNIKSQSLREFPQECCGLIIEKSNRNVVFPTRNCAEDKLHNFIINPLDYIFAADIGKVKAFYHSHCNYNFDFSPLDKFSSINHKLPLILYNIKNDNFKIYNENDNSFLDKYVGIKFECNKSDCLGMVQKFYKEEFNIILPQIDRDNNWTVKNKNIIEENIYSFGFNKVNDKDNLKYGDVLLMHLPVQNNIRHLMIYLDNNQVLQNRLNSYSSIEIYNNKYKELTSFVVRHGKML